MAGGGRVGGGGADRCCHVAATPVGAAASPQATAWHSVLRALSGVIMHPQSAICQLAVGCACTPPPTSTHTYYFALCMLAAQPLLLPRQRSTGCCCEPTTAQAAAVNLRLHHCSTPSSCRPAQLHGVLRCSATDNHTCCTCFNCMPKHNHCMLLSDAKAQPLHAAFR